MRDGAIRAQLSRYTTFIWPRSDWGPLWENDDHLLKVLVIRLTSITDALVVVVVVVIFTLFNLCQHDISHVSHLY
jgi:hypothetical protein